MSKLLKSALAMKVKACHFGSDDRFHNFPAPSQGRSIIYENWTYKDPGASEIGVSPFKRTECSFPVYSGLRRHKARVI